jgi:hypothetical protein
MMKEKVGMRGSTPNRDQVMAIPSQKPGARKRRDVSHLKARISAQDLLKI